MNNTKIELEYEGEKYTLEYTRATVKLLEANNFDVREWLTKPMTNVQLAFQAAFVKNHPKVSIDTIDDIFKHCPDKDGLIATLTKMITDTYEDLLNSTDENDPKKAIWKTVDLSPKKTETK